MRRIVGWTTAVLGGLWFALGCIGNFQTAQSIIQDRGATVRAIYQTMPWSQWVGLAIFLSGIALLIWSHRRRHFELTESDQNDAPLSEKLPRKAYFTGGSKTLSHIAQAHVPKPVRIEKPAFNRQAVLIKVRDLVISTEKQPSSERFDVIGALIKFADEFETEEQVEWVCAELEQRQFKDPFKIMASAVPGIFDGRKLEFLCDARTAKIEIRTTMSAMTFVTKYWRHSDEFNKGHRAQFEPPAHAQGQRESRAMLSAIVDKLSAGVKPLRALQEVHADELDTNDMLLQLRDDLIKFGHADPFRVIKDTIPQDKWLEFLQAARLQGLNLSDELALLDLLQEQTPHIKLISPTAHELLVLTKGKTGLQASEILRPYKESWIQAEGKVRQLHELQTGQLALVVQEPNTGKMVGCQFDAKWKSALNKEVNIGDNVRLRGKLRPQQPLVDHLQLMGCELTPPS